MRQNSSLGGLFIYLLTQSDYPLEGAFRAGICVEVIVGECLAARALEPFDLLRLLAEVLLCLICNLLPVREAQNEGIRDELQHQSQPHARLQAHHAQLKLESEQASHWESDQVEKHDSVATSAPLEAYGANRTLQEPLHAVEEEDKGDQNQHVFGQLLHLRLS